MKYSISGNSRCFLNTLIFIIYIFIISCSFPRFVLLKDPLTPEEHLNLGVTYEKDGNFEYAIKEYKKALPYIPLALLYIGNVYFNKREYNLAEKYYREAIKKDPMNADAYNNLAWLYYTKRENLEEAEALVINAIKLNEKNKDIYYDTLKKIREIKRDD